MSHPQDQTPSSSALSSQAWLVLAVVLIADSMDLLDSTITNIAAPSIVRDLGGGESLVKWLGASYALAMGVALVLGGRLGDRFGKRRMFLIGIAGFTIASLCCGLSTSPAAIIVARTLQGAFGALLIPQGFGLITLVFPREHFGKAFSAFGPVMGVSAIGGPILAGFLIHQNVAGLTWRPVFLINIVFGVAGFVAALKWLPRDARAETAVVDAAGSGLLAGAMFGSLYGLIEGSSNGWTGRSLAALATGVVLFLGFALRQATAKTPLIEPSLLRNKGFNAGMIIGIAFFAAVNGLAYVLSLFLQHGLGRNTVQASMSLAPLAIGIVAASAVLAPLIQKLGRTLILVGLVLTLLGTIGLQVAVTVFGASVGGKALAAGLFIAGVGMGGCFGTIFDVALGDTTEKEAGSASGTLSAVQQLASGIGSAAMTTVYFGSLGTGVVHAISVSLQTVAVTLLGCCGLVWLLPRQAILGDHGHS